VAEDDPDVSARRVVGVVPSPVVRCRCVVAGAHATESTNSRIPKVTIIAATTTTKPQIVRSHLKQLIRDFAFEFVFSVKSGHSRILTHTAIQRSPDLL